MSINNETSIKILGNATTVTDPNLLLATAVTSTRGKKTLTVINV